MNNLTKSALPKVYITSQQSARLLNAGLKPTYEQLKKLMEGKESSSSSTHSDKDDDSLHISDQ
jgi:hypothetical protein